MNEIDWIAVDWGTSNLRCFGVTDSGEVIAKAESGNGMAAVAKSGGDFEQALLALVEPWLSSDKVTPVIACGMVGAKQGWQEVAYQAVPCSPVTELTQIETRSSLLEVWIHAGVKQYDPADVMRGEETLVAGFLKINPGYSGMICMPGTHSKWVEMAGGEMVSFRTFMTGEVFDLLANQSVLQYSVARDGHDHDAFLNGIEASLENPSTILQRCFSIRAEDLLVGANDIVFRSKLSGMLIGMEFASAREMWDFDNMAIIGTKEFTALYQAAASLVDISTTSGLSEDVILGGLHQGYLSLKPLGSRALD